MNVVPMFALRDFPKGILAETEQALVQELRRQQFILGDKVVKLESAFAKYLQTKHVIGTGNGYDALFISLKALQLQPGSKVIIPANGYFATANAVVQAGLKPVLAEPEEETANLSARTIAAALTSKTKVLLPIHLYGNPCPMPEIMQLAKQHNLFVIEDFAQAHGAKINEKMVGTFGNINATSFYPTKNLGAAGDAGAVTTANPELADFVQTYRNYGQKEKYINTKTGVNSRLDSLQAAVLLAKLPYLNQLNQERQRLAEIYLNELQEIPDLILPATTAGAAHVYHLFVIRTAKRDALQMHLKQLGVQTQIHYPLPIHLQPAYQFLGHKNGDFPVAEKLAQTSLSLPLFPGLTETDQQLVISSIKNFFRK